MTRQIQTPGAAPDADATRDQLRAQLDALGIPYTTRDTKAELQAKLDAAQQPSIDPNVPIDPAVPPQGEVDYEAILEDCERNINGYKQQIEQLKSENADLRAKVAKYEAPNGIAAPSKAPAPQLTGMRLTDEGYVVG